jgi:hypothetical protein
MEYYTIQVVQNKKKEESKLYDVASNEEAIKDGLRIAKRNKVNMFSIYHVKEKNLFGFIPVIKMVEKEEIFKGTVEEAPNVS